MYELLRNPGEVDSLQTARLLLRPLTVEDAPAYWPLVSNAEILRHVGETPRGSLDEVITVLRERPLADYARHGYGRLGVVERESGRMIGWCGLKVVPELGGEVDIGYRLLPEYWGRGYATEAGRAVIAHGFEQLQLARIVGMTVAANVDSARVLEKLGLRFERELQMPGHAELVRLFAIHRPAA